MRHLKNSKRLFFFRSIDLYEIKFEDERLILGLPVLKFCEESGKKKTPSSCVGKKLRSGLVGVFDDFIIFSGGGVHVGNFE